VRGREGGCRVSEEISLLKEISLTHSKRGAWEKGGGGRGLALFTVRPLHAPTAVELVSTLVLAQGYISVDTLQ
jgi:hypothetical protein